MSNDTHVTLDGKGSSRSQHGHGETGRICCIFSTSKSQKIRRGTTLRGHAHMHHWLVRQVGETAYGVRGVDGDYQPFSDEVRITAEELIRDYTPEVAVFEDKMLPALKHRSTLLSDGQPWRFSGDDDVSINEANVRGLFELGLEYLMARKTARGHSLVRELIRLKTPFPGKDQFLFNEFGIRLRKVGFYEGAVICYRRGLKYTEHDDHLYYNLARVYYEQGQWWDCMGALASCFALNPDLPLARDLVVLIAALADDAGLRARYRKPPVPDGVARRAGLLVEAVYTHDVKAVTLAKANTIQAEDRRKTNLWLPGREAAGL